MSELSDQIRNAMVTAQEINRHTDEPQPAKKT
jgi:hypothetical protein